MELFYTTDMDGEKATLGGQEATHCIKVLRHRLGHRLHLVDGNGGLFQVEITAIRRNEVETRIINRNQMTPSDVKDLPTVAFGILKSDTRTEWMLEKLVEIGVSRVVPLICKHCEKRHLRHARLERIMISAMKQSNRRFLPQLLPPQDFKAWLLSQSHDRTLVAHYRPGQPDLSELSKVSPAHLVIGPEGDFSIDEIQAMEERSLLFYNLGRSRLRAETAAVVSCTLWNFK